MGGHGCAGIGNDAQFPDLGKRGSGVGLLSACWSLWIYDISRWEASDSVSATREEIDYLVVCVMIIGF